VRDSQTPLKEIKITATKTVFLPNAPIQNDRLTPDSRQTQTPTEPTIASFTFLATWVATVRTYFYFLCIAQTAHLQVKWWILPREYLFQASKCSLTCRKNLRLWADGFISPPKKGVLRTFVALVRVWTREPWVQWNLSLSYFHVAAVCAEWKVKACDVFVVNIIFTDTALKLFGSWVAQWV
jgi:hypothetical protein